MNSHIFEHTFAHVTAYYTLARPRPLMRPGPCDNGGIMRRKSGLMSGVRKRSTVEMM
jgi:hypothetical protein